MKVINQEIPALKALVTSEIAALNAKIDALTPPEPKSKKKGNSKKKG